MLTPALEQTLERALGLANERRHEYATVEHLLLALTDDADAAAVLHGCRVDLGRLRSDLHRHLDDALANLVRGEGTESMPTAGFQRVLQRAAIHVQSAGGADVNGANLLVALFSEKESYAVYFLREQDLSRSDVISCLSHGVARPSTIKPAAARFDAAESALRKARDEQQLGRYGHAVAHAHAALLIAMDMACEARGLVHGSTNANRSLAVLRASGLLPESVDGLLVTLDAALTSAQANGAEQHVAEPQESMLLLQTTAAALRFIAGMRREAGG